MTPAEILTCTATMYRTTVRDIEGAKSAKTIGLARAAAVFVLRESRQSSPLTFGQIARRLHRPTKSIWYWWVKARRLREGNPKFRLVTDALLAVAICPTRGGE